MLTRSRLLLMLFLLGGACIVQADEALDTMSASIALGGKDVLTHVQSSPVVRVQRVDSPDPSTYAEGERPALIELGKPFAVPPGAASELQTIFGEGATYLAPPKRCRFRANVRYFFDGEGPPIVIVLCFGCGELEVWRSDQMLAFSPFDASYARLLEVTKKLFPEDAFLAEFSPEVFEERVKAMRDVTK